MQIPIEVMIVPELLIFDRPQCSDRNDLFASQDEPGDSDWGIDSVTYRCRTVDRYLPDYRPCPRPEHQSFLPRRFRRAKNEGAISGANLSAVGFNNLDS